MTLPFVIDNQQHRAADALNHLLAQSRSAPLDIASAYFSVSGYRLLKDGLDGLGALRLLLGHEPQHGTDVGLRPRLIQQMVGEMAAMPLDEPTMRLVEDLIAFLNQEKVQVRLYEKGFLHAKAYIFHQDRVGPYNFHDRMRPYAAIVGSSNFTGPGLATNKELNLVHRVFTDADPALDTDAAGSAAYLREDQYRREIDGPPPPSETDLFNAPPPRRANPDTLPVNALFDDRVSGAERRQIKSEVGARAVMDLERWFQNNWTDAGDFKPALIDLLNRSKFGQFEYTPYQVYMKALYEYLKDSLDATDQMLLGKTAVDLAEFQEDSVKRARRILQRYDGVLVADSVGLGKTWIGKRLLEDFAYHRRQKAVVVCPASLRDMWRRELAASTIAASVVGMEELGRDSFDSTPYADADVLLIDEAHNFRSKTANRYTALDDMIQRNRGKGRDGERKKIILLSATPINNDLFDLYNQVMLFAQGEQDYFADAGIGDLKRYFLAARRAARTEGRAPGELLFNLLEEFVVRNTRPYIKAAYPKATIRGEAVRFPDRQLKTIEYSLSAVWGGGTLYKHIVDQIGALSLAPYALETYRKPECSTDATKFEAGREEGLVGIFKTRFLKRLESSIEAFRLSVHRAMVFEKVYLDFLLKKQVIASRDFWKMVQISQADVDEEGAPDGLADELLEDEDVREYLKDLKPVALNEFRAQELLADVERDIATLDDLHRRIEPLVKKDTKVRGLKDLLAGDLKGKKVLIFTSYKDTARYLEKELKDEKWLERAGNPHVRRIDSHNHPSERTGIVAAFAPKAMADSVKATDREIDILVSTDVLSEGQNLQDCGVMVNYDLTWNPIRLVQRAGRIDRLRSPHETIQICNMFPERELEDLLHLIERLADRISQIDDVGMMDSSVLGEVVHPRTFNALRRVKGEDVSVLDEEEARAELAGPELLLKTLREMLNKTGAEAALNLPDGIHSGLRRTGKDGMFFYFKAPRNDGSHRHFWRYHDQSSGAISDNRFEIAQIIACQTDEPRHVGNHDPFKSQERLIDDIIAGEQKTAAREVVTLASDPIQQALAADVKAAMRKGSVDRDLARAVVPFLGQPAGRAVIQRLKAVRADWSQHGNDPNLILELSRLRDDYGKGGDSLPISTVARDNLRLVCFEHVSPQA